MPKIDLGNFTGFEWDKGNIEKSQQKHKVTVSEAEEIFLDEALQVIEDINHSQKEERFAALGKTFIGKILFTVFTLRSSKIRIISARLANKRERSNYEQELKKNSQI